MISAKASFTPRNNLGQFIPAIITPAVQASVESSTALIQQLAQEKCPVDTGALRDSITTELVPGDKSISGRVGPHVFYADYVEYGTGRRGDPAAPYGHVESWPGQVPQPYMRPAIDEARGSILELFRSQIGAAIA